MRYRLLWLAGLLAGLSPVNAAAHEVQIAEDVGATLHIEPNDIAQAGAPTELWFALTQAGGTVIPLTACDCRLTLYDNQETAISQPSLTAVSAEGFNAIPGATVTFPEVGRYELVLSGSPQPAAQFAPFELRFAVTVASRVASAPPAESAAAAPTTAAPNNAAATDPDRAAPPEATAIAPAAETPAPPSTSTLGWVAALVGGAIVVVGIGIAFIGGRRSSGGKQ